MNKHTLTSVAIILFLFAILSGCSLPGWQKAETESIEQVPVKPELDLDLSGIFIGSWLEWSESKGQKTGYVYSFYEDGRVLVSRQDMNGVVMQGAYTFIGDETFSIVWSLPGSELYFDEMTWVVHSIKNNELTFWVDNERFVALKRLETQLSTFSPPLNEDPPTPPPPPIIDPVEPIQSGSNEIAPLVTINEIAWAGTSADAADQWIELQNNTDSPIDLTDWTLSWGSGDEIHTIKITDIEESDAIKINTFELAANGYYMLERADDESIHGIGADLIFASLLNPDGERLELRNAAGELIDTANMTGGPWPAGTSADGAPIAFASMERISASDGDHRANWASFSGPGSVGFDGLGEEIQGTPGAANSHSIN